MELKRRNEWLLVLEVRKYQLNDIELKDVYKLELIARDCSGTGSASVVVLCMLRPAVYIYTTNKVYFEKLYSKIACTRRKKGTKAVTGVVPFQKVNFCPF